MVQEFHVVRCFSCQTFQVHQVKKIKKWNCKMCGEKQSLVKEYGRGSGAECRRHVQKLNSIRGELHEAEHARFSCVLEEEEEDAVHEGDQVLPPVVEQMSQTFSSGHKLELEGKPSSESRWCKYLSETAEEEEPDEASLEDDNVYTGRRTNHSCRPGNNRNAGKRKRSWGFSRSAPEPARPEHRGAAAGRSAVKDPWIRARQRTHHEGKDDSQTSSWAESEISHDAAVTRNLPPAPEARPPPAACREETEIGRSKWSRFLTAPREDEENDEERNASASTSGNGAGGEGIIRPSSVPRPVLTSHFEERKHFLKELEEVSLTTKAFVGNLEKRPLREDDGFTFSPGYHRFQTTANHKDGLGLSYNGIPSAAALVDQPQNLSVSKPRPSLHSLFQTDEDFDDTF